MLDAIATMDNLGMEAAADIPTTDLDTTPITEKSQGSSIQETDLSQSLLDMMSSLDMAENPSLRLVSNQSVADALADSIPGLDPTTLPDSLQQNPADNPAMMDAIGKLDDPDTLSEAFQTVSDGFEGLSKSFEMLAATFLAQDGDLNSGLDTVLDTVAIGTEGDDTNADLKLVKNGAIASESDDPDLDVENGAIGSEADDTELDVENGVIGKTDDDADLDVEKVLGSVDFDLDFDALKINVAQVSKGLQFLVEQLEAAFEGDDAGIAETANV
jgi:hypothetical protein